VIPLNALLVKNNGRTTIFLVSVSNGANGAKLFECKKFELQRFNRKQIWHCFGLLKCKKRQYKPDFSQLTLENRQENSESGFE
jgi:hypothetical protein